MTVRQGTYPRPVALALYRKYRPATFAEVVGQEHVTEPLRTALAAGRINHAYLFSGPRGCGKTSSARILARSLNCVHGPTPDPCGECPSCIALAPEGPGSLDVVELDAASHGGVEDTRELRDRAFYMPAESRYRVFIIDEAHMVTTQGFNALLKIVEEPPEHLVFIFATTEPDKVLTTIRSRTHHYPFRLIPPQTMRGLLERLTADEGVTVDPAVYPLVIRAGGGSARDSLSVLDQLLAGAGPEGVTYPHAVALLGVTDAALLDEMVDALAADDGASVFGAVDKVVEAGHDPRRFAADLLQRLRDLLILDAVPDAAEKGLLDAPEDELAAMAAQAERLGRATLSRMADVVHTGLTDMRGTTAPRLVLELMCARMLLPTVAGGAAGGAAGSAGVLQRLERMERRMSIASAPEIAPQGPAESTADAVRRSAAGEPARPTSTARQQVSRDQTHPAKDDRAAAERPSAGREESRPEADARGGPDASRDQPDAPSAPGQQQRADPQQRPGAEQRRGSLLPPPPTLRSSRPASGTRPPEEATDGGTAGTGSAAAAAGADRAAGADPAADGPSRSGGSQQPGAAADAASAHSETTAAATDSASAGAQPGIGVTDVRKVWSEVLEAVKRRRRTTQILLESATVAAVDGTTLVLTMPHAGMAKRVVEPANADLLSAALNEILGVDWSIRCDTGSAESRGAATDSRQRGGATRPQQPARPADRGAPPAPRAPDRQMRPTAAARPAQESDDIPLPPEPDPEDAPPDDGYRGPSRRAGQPGPPSPAAPSDPSSAPQRPGRPAPDQPPTRGARQPGRQGRRPAGASSRSGGDESADGDSGEPARPSPAGARDIGAGAGGSDVGWDQADEVPDDWNDPDPQRPAVVHDPEQAAIELLASELGARKLDLGD